MVSETSFKFFIQFVFYTLIFCAFSLIICATFTAEIIQDVRKCLSSSLVCRLTVFFCIGWRSQCSSGYRYWIVSIFNVCFRFTDRLLTISRSSLFGLFSFGMTISSLQLAMWNLSTIENLNRRSAVWTLAIRVPDRMLARLNPESRWAPTFRTITYPLPPVPLSPEAARDYQPPEKQYVFAILQTLPGENPFDLGSRFKNLQQVLGYSIIDWFLPLRQSPCADRTTGDSFYELGPVVSRLKKEAGLDPPPESQPTTQNDTERKHKRRRSSHRRSQG